MMFSLSFVLFLLLNQPRHVPEKQLLLTQRRDERNENQRIKKGPSVSPLLPSVASLRRRAVA